MTIDIGLPAGVDGPTPQTAYLLVADTCGKVTVLAASPKFDYFGVADPRM